MSDRVNLMKLLEAVESHRLASQGARVGPTELDLLLYEKAHSIRAKLDAQEQAEWEAAHIGEVFERTRTDKSFGGSD